MKKSVCLFALVFFLEFFLSPCRAQMLQGEVAGSNVAGVSGQWYYASPSGPGSDNFPTDSGSVSLNYVYCSPVAVTGGTTITKIDAKLYADNGYPTKIGLFTLVFPDLTPVALASCTVPAATGTGWIGAAACSSLSVAVQTPLWVCIDNPGNDMHFNYNNTTVSNNYGSGALAYTSFPAAAVISYQANVTMGVRIWAQ